MTKRMTLIAFAALLFAVLGAQYTVNFEGAGETKTAYASGDVTLSGISWNMTEALIGTDAADFKNGARSARLRGYGTSVMTMLANKSNGIGNITFQYRRYGTDAQVDWMVEYSVNNGTNWLQAGSSFTAPDTDDVQTFSATINVTGTARIRITRATASGTSNRRLNIDDIVLTDYTPALPSIIVNPNTLSGFTYTLGNGPSTSQSYTLTAANLSPASGSISISGSTNYEVSTDNSSFGSSRSISYSSGTVTGVTLYVRLKAGLPAGTYNLENIQHSGGGASAPLGVSGDVTSPIVALNSGGYTQDFSTFVSLATLPFGWGLSDTYTYMGDFGTGTTGGILGNGVLGIQLTSTAPNNELTATLTLSNQTGAAITSLVVSYFGRFARTEVTGTPKWVVRVNGTIIPELEYQTASGINETKSATIGGLNIAPGGLITITWYTTSAETSGTRRQIGIDDVLVTTQLPSNPQILVTGALNTFSTGMGSPSAAQSYQLSGNDLSSNIMVSAPSGFELSTDGMAYSAALSLSPVFSGSIYVRMTGALNGTFGGNIQHSSSGASDVNLLVAGTVTGGITYATDLFFSEYIEGSSNNKALEIFNGTGMTVNLSDYKVDLYSNGSSTVGNTVTLSGTLAHGDVFVIANSSANASILALADITSTVTFFNGDDALALKKISTDSYVDIFGMIGQDPGTAWTAAGEYSTLDKTLVRKSTVTQGVTVNPSGYAANDPAAFPTLGTEWDLYPIDTITYLGSHTFEGGQGTVETPTIQASQITAYPANTEITLEWTPGNGSYRLVKMNTINSFTAPVDGNGYSANTSYSGSGEQVIYNGGTQIIEGIPFNGVSVSNLNPNTTYWFRVYEYNGTGSSSKYLSVTGANNPRSATTTNSQSTGYYAGISGYGNTLKSNLHTLLRTTHTTRYSYDALWTQLPYTDEDPNNTNNIIQIYTGWSVPKTHNGGGTTQWNREHTWSKSHGDFGDVAPAGTDLHHLRPCDSTVNSAKGNKDFDDGGTPYTDASPYPGYSGVTGCNTSTYTWEPRSEDKGDVARMMMYMAVRYEGTDTSYNLELVDYVNTAPADQPFYGKLSTLLNWHVQDPPDARERQRNERIFERQGNRNPFIDNPAYAQYIWTPVPTQVTGVTQTSFTANWSVPITATKYYLQVATDSLFTNLVTGYSDYDAGLNTNRTISGLSNSNTYYYRLRSYFLSGYSMYSPFLAVQLYTPTPVVTLTPQSALFEYGLNGAVLNVTLSNTSFSDANLAMSSFTLNGAPAGLTLQAVQYINATTATLVLAFDGTDFDNNAAISITIAALELSTPNPVSSSVVSITAYVESMATIEMISGSIVLNISPVVNAASYRVFAASDPYGSYTDVTTTGTFTSGVPTRWSMLPASSMKRFFRVAAIRN